MCIKNRRQEENQKKQEKKIKLFILKNKIAFIEWLLNATFQVMNVIIVIKMQRNYKFKEKQKERFILSSGHEIQKQFSSKFHSPANIHYRSNFIKVWPGKKMHILS